MTLDPGAPAPRRPGPARADPACGHGPLRAVLSALGIAIGIAAMTAVVGISSSSQADLDRTLAALGTNLLTVTPGQTMFGEDAKLPDESVAMIRRIGPVQSATATGTVSDTSVYRTDKIPSGADRRHRRPRRRARPARDGRRAHWPAALG